MSELKPCPFCGSTNWSLWYDGAYYCVACVDCEAQGSKGETRDEAVEAWNKAIRDAVKGVTEPKNGNWEVCDILDYAQRPSGRKILRCPFCGYLTGEFRSMVDYYHTLTHFCPNCGVEMGGVKE